MSRFECTLLFPLLLAAALSARAQEAGPQIYNLSLDAWSRQGKVWYPYGTGAPALWDSGNKATATLGVNVTVPEEEHLAKKGPGKRAAKLKSQFVGVAGLGKFSSAALYTGRFVKLIGMSGAQFAFGIPFTARPKSLHGYLDYTSGTIDYTDKAHAAMKGRADHGHVEIYITRWKEPFIIDNSRGVALDPKLDPDVIGYGILELSGDTHGYVEFDIPIVYTSDAEPRYLGIMASSSKWGSFYTGSTGSTLYLDELELRY